MTFLKPVTGCLCSEINNGVIASDEVLTGKLKGRHAVAIMATSDSRIGDKKVLKKKTIGILLEEGKTMIIPVDPSRVDQLYINGTCDLTEFF